MLRRAILVVAGLATAGCVSVPTAPPELQAVALTFKPSPGMARIYVYRPGGAFGGASKLSVAIDSQIVGRTAAGTYMMVEVRPGPHRVSSPTGENGYGPRWGFSALILAWNGWMLRRRGLGSPPRGWCRAPGRARRCASNRRRSRRLTSA